VRGDDLISSDRVGRELLETRERGPIPQTFCPFAVAKGSFEVLVVLVESVQSCDRGSRQQGPLFPSLVSPTQGQGRLGLAS
jgi:hypothetical protein